MESGSLWNYYGNEVNDLVNETVANRKMNNSKIKTSRSFECKTKIVGRTPDNNNILNTEVVVPSKYLINF